MIGFDCPKSEETDCGSRLGLQLTSRSETTSARQPTSPSQFLFRPGNRIQPSPMHPRPQKPFSRAEAKNSLLTCCAALRKRNTSLAADSMRPQLRGAASSGTQADSHDGPVPLHYRVPATQRRFPIRAKTREPALISRSRIRRHQSSGVSKSAGLELGSSGLFLGGQAGSRGPGRWSCQH